MSWALDVLAAHRQFGAGCTGCSWMSSDVTKRLADDHRAHVATLIEEPVRAVHWTFDETWCENDGLSWPCPTIRALDESDPVRLGD